MRHLCEKIYKNRFNIKSTILLQTLVGWLLIYIYSININSLHALIGNPNVRISPIEFNNNSFYNFVTYPFITVFLFSLGYIFAILMCFKIGGRIIVALNCVFFTSFINAAYAISDGGDNLLKLLLIYMIFLKYSEEKSHELSNLIHNIGVICIFLQICIIYFIAGTSKMNGLYWQNGSAMHYILQLKSFSNNIFSIDKLIISNEFICLFISYVTILFQIGYPFLIFQKKVKNMMIFIGILFHLGIGILMNLPSFSMAMIFAEIFLIDDKSIDKYTSMTAILYARIKNRHLNLLKALT